MWMLHWNERRAKAEDAHEEARVRWVNQCAWKQMQDYMQGYA